MCHSEKRPFSLCAVHFIPVKRFREKRRRRKKEKKKKKKEEDKMSFSLIMSFVFTSLLLLCSLFVFHFPVAVLYARTWCLFLFQGGKWTVKGSESKTEKQQMGSQSWRKSSCWGKCQLDVGISPRQIHITKVNARTRTHKHTHTHTHTHTHARTQARTHTPTHTQLHHTHTHTLTLHYTTFHYTHTHTHTQSLLHHTGGLRRWPETDRKRCPA